MREACKYIYRARESERDCERVFCVCVCVCIYIYRERERERERDGDADWIHLTQNGTQWSGLVDTTMKLRVLRKARNFSVSSFILHGCGT